MNKFTRNCDFCQEEYLAEQRYINRGQGLYCSRTCASKANHAKRKVDHELNTVCSYCDKPFYRSPSKKVSSRSGLFFCCREHKDLAQRIGGIKEIQPDHYGEVTKDYRSTAFKTYPHCCHDCGYDEHEEVLQVHHVDINHNNNEIENLVILCPTCHEVRHLLTKTGRWK